MKALISLLKWFDKKCTSFSMRAMKWTGRHDKAIHPKHLYDTQRNIFLHDRMEQDIVFLDIGCGAGSDCLQALKHGAAKIYGIDIKRDSLAVARGRLASYEGRFELLAHDLETAQLPLPDQSVDLINFSNVLEHLHNRQGVLAELCRILKPGGVIYISIPNRNTPWKKLQRKHGVDSRDDPDHKIEYDEKTLTEELKQASLVITTPLHTVIPSLPINGVFSLTAIINKRIYQALQKWKLNYAAAHPHHSVGWYFLAERANSQE